MNPNQLIGETIGTLNSASGRGVPGDNVQDASAGMLIPEVSPAMKARDHKGVSSDGTGDGLPIIPVVVATFPEFLSGAQAGVNDDGSTSRTLQADNPTAIVLPRVPISFGSKDHGADAAEQVAPTLRAGGFDTSHANAGVPPAVAIPFDTTQITHPENRSNPQPDDPAGTLPKAAHAPAIAFQPRFARNGRGAPDEEVTAPLTAQAGETGKGDSANVVAYEQQQRWAVRRLTPLECCRLQGFPDDYLSSVKFRGKPPADGPMYKALGNSMATNVMQVLGERIALVDAL
jgi:DNA (cytosine-5)-methyltransferase 1